jgi:hypothetical protein
MMQNTMTAPPLQGMANLLEDQGRYGDTELVHMSKPEVRGLQSLGRLTRNPETGLMEAFSIGGFFKDYVAPAALFAIPTIGPYLSAGYTGIKSGIESGNALTGITSGLLSYGLGKVGSNLFKGMFGGAEGKALSAGQEMVKEGMEQGIQKGFTKVGSSVIRPDLVVTNPSVEALKAGAYSAGQVGQAIANAPGKVLEATAQNLMTPETVVRGLASGITADLTRTPEYAEATGFVTDDSAREPVLAENRNFAMGQQYPEGLSASQILASQTGQGAPLQFTDPKYSPAETGSISGTLLAKKGGMLDALDSITEGMEELAEQTDGDVSIEGMIKAAAEGGMMDDVKVNPMSNLKQIAMGQQRPFEGRVMGQGDGMSDEIPFSIEGQQPALLSRDEYVLPADVVSALGNGSSNAGADKLDNFLTDVRKKVMGRERQINQIG